MFDSELSLIQKLQNTIDTIASTIMQNFLEKDHHTHSQYYCYILYNFHLHNLFKISLPLYSFILFNFATRPGSPQQHKSITVRPYYLTHPFNFPCGRHQSNQGGNRYSLGKALAFTIYFHMRNDDFPLSVHLMQIYCGSQGYNYLCPPYLWMEKDFWSQKSFVSNIH